MMKQSLHPAGQLLWATANQGDDLVGTQKPVPVDEPENFVVARRQLDGRNRGHALESGKAGHPARMTGTGKMGETLEFAQCGNQPWITVNPASTTPETHMARATQVAAAGEVIAPNNWPASSEIQPGQFLVRPRAVCASV